MIKILSVCCGILLVVVAIFTIRINSLEKDLSNANSLIESQNNTIQVLTENTAILQEEISLWNQKNEELTKQHQERVTNLETAVKKNPVWGSTKLPDDVCRLFK